MNNLGPKPRNPSLAVSCVASALQTHGDAAVEVAFAEVVNALTWMTEESNRVNELLLQRAVGTDPDAGQES